MLEISSFSLQTHTGPYENWPLKSRLYHNNLPTKTYLPGYIIEAQYQIKEYYLIINSWDCPFEESNEFILLNSDFKIKSRRCLGAAYSTYTIDSLKVVSDSQLLITLWDNSQYTLTVFQRLWFLPKPWLSLRKMKSESAV